LGCARTTNPPRMGIACPSPCSRKRCRTWASRSRRSHRTCPLTVGASGTRGAPSRMGRLLESTSTGAAEHRSQTFTSLPGRDNQGIEPTRGVANLGLCRLKDDWRHRSDRPVIVKIGRARALCASRHRPWSRHSVRCPSRVACVHSRRTAFGATLALVSTADHSASRSETLCEAGINAPPRWSFWPKVATSCGPDRVI
jgi:hypothetical protein